MYFAEWTANGKNNLYQLIANLLFFLKTCTYMIILCVHYTANPLATDTKHLHVFKHGNTYLSTVSDF